MSQMLDRRFFVKQCGLFGCTAMATLLRPGDARADNSIPPALREGEEISDDFIRAEVALLRRSLNVFYDRIFTVKVQACFNSQGGNPAPPPGVENPGILHDDDTFQKWDETLREYGRSALSLQLGRLENRILLDGKYKFPKIKIGAYHAKPGGNREIDAEYGNSVAYGYYGTILVGRGPDGGYKGCFDIAINRYYLDAASQPEFKDPVYWAGVITHELCHNLGHKHPKGDDPDYHKYQMVLLEYALRTNGNFKYGDKQVRTFCKAAPRRD